MLFFSRRHLEKSDVKRLHVRPAFPFDEPLDHGELVPHAAPGYCRRAAPPFRPRSPDDPSLLWREQKNRHEREKKKNRKECTAKTDSSKGENEGEVVIPWWTRRREYVLKLWTETRLWVTSMSVRYWTHTCTMTRLLSSCTFHVDSRFLWARFFRPI